MEDFTRRLLITCAAVFISFTLVLFAILVWFERRIERALSAAASGEAEQHTVARQLAAIDAQAEEAGRGLATVEACLGTAR